MAIRYVDVDPVPKVRVKQTVPVASQESMPMPRTPPKNAKSPTPELAAIIGSGPIPRTEAVKRIWAYIKANSLQDATDKRNINCDTAMKAIFGVDKINMFKMNKALGEHFV